MNIYGKAWCPLKIINTVVKEKRWLISSWSGITAIILKFRSPVAYRWVSYFFSIPQGNKLYKNLNLVERIKLRV